MMQRAKIGTNLAQVGLCQNPIFYRQICSDAETACSFLPAALILNPQVLVADEPFAP